MRTDAELIVDPDTYTSGVPHDALTRLREKNVVRADDFWAVLRYSDVLSGDLRGCPGPAGTPAG